MWHISRYHSQVSAASLNVTASSMKKLNYVFSTIGRSNSYILENLLKYFKNFTCRYAEFIFEFTRVHNSVTKDTYKRKRQICRCWEEEEESVKVVKFFFSFRLRSHGWPSFVIDDAEKSFELQLPRRGKDSEASWKGCKLLMKLWQRMKLGVSISDELHDI